MTTLTDTQLVMLSSAAQRPDHAIVLPERLKGQAARNTLERLLARGLVEEVAASGSLPVWRHDDEGAYALRITTAGLSAIGLEPEDATADGSTDGAASDQQGNPQEPQGAARPRSAHPRCGSKQALIVSLLSRQQGATLAEITAATGWLPHTARAALTGLRQKGYALTSSKEISGARTYRITASSGRAKAGA
jgi:predicted ArsR family transcriptional regulator